jgi:uncharacterized membrane protein YkvA (DUF1232 family)
LTERITVDTTLEHAHRGRGRPEHRLGRAADRSGRGPPKDISVTDALRLLPDTVVLLRRLAADPQLPRGVRVRLLLVLLYLILPTDLVPDVIPVLGYADDAIVVAAALRSVARRAGPDAVDKHWPGTPEGLHAIRRLAGIPSPPET